MEKTPFVHPQQLVEAFRPWLDSSRKTLEGVFDQVRKAEALGTEKAAHLVRETARLTEETLEYGKKLSEAGRQMALEAMRRVSGETTKSGDTTNEPK
jgi:hypothetical protein